MVQAWLSGFSHLAALAHIGGGLAGCEAAWQAALCGVDVTLYEMRPERRSPAHKTDSLAELVCSNSLRGAALENAVGLLKEELARLDSLIIGAARETEINIVGGRVAAAQARVLSSNNIHAHNSFQNPRALEPRDEPVTPGAGGRLVYRFAPASVTRLTLSLV